MTQYWTYVPGHAMTDGFSFFEEGLISIGWGEFGDLHGYQNKEIKKLVIVRELHLKYKDANFVLDSIVNKMKIGDVVYVLKYVEGKLCVLGRGVVASDYEFDVERSRHIRKINWTHQGEWEYLWPVERFTAHKALIEISGKRPGVVKGLEEMFSSLRS